MATSKKKLPDEAVAVENFYGVYLLYCTNPKYKGRTYIGFTVDPNRRINQHNTGIKAGGAWRTSKCGPWEMVLIIHGFMNDIAALKFEWAWQHPERSRHLREHFTPKKSSEQTFLYNLRILAEMLSTGPWKRLPLTVQWLAPTFEKPFPAHRSPPLHMAICYGPIYSVKNNAESTRSINYQDKVNHSTKMCWVCTEFADPKEMLTCIHPKCLLYVHTVCLAKTFLEEESSEIIPIEGSCPRCKSKVLWGDLIKKKKGCYFSLKLNDDCDSSILDS